MRLFTSMGCSSTSKPATVARAFRGRKETGENAHGGGFPGAVGAEKAHDLALLHFERDVVHRQQCGRISS